MKCTLVFLREDGRDGMSYELGHVSTPVEALRAYSSRACVPEAAWLPFVTRPNAFRIDWDDGQSQVVWASTLAAAPERVFVADASMTASVDDVGNYVCWWEEPRVDPSMTWRKHEGWSPVKS